jgi:hypothetical protein
MSFTEIKLRQKTFAPLTTKGSKLSADDGDDQVIGLYQRIMTNFIASDTIALGEGDDKIPVTVNAELINIQLLELSTCEEIITGFDLTGSGITIVIVLNGLSSEQDVVFDISDGLKLGTGDSMKLEYQNASAFIVSPSVQTLIQGTLQFS